MRNRILAVGVASVSFGFVGCSGSGGDQSAPGESGSAGTAASMQDFAYPDGTPHPVTAWGDPDLQGMWPIMHLISTGLQRRDAYGDRQSLTDEEWESAQANLVRRDSACSQLEESGALGMGCWAESTTRSDAARLTSLISYPDDGQFPELTARGEALRSEFGSSWSTESGDGIFESPQADFDTWDRCITRGMPNSMLPFNYNNGIQLLQSPGFVAINLEMIHEVRIVPLDREPLDSSIKQWMGESRGYWDGATLVVETTNYNGKVGMTNVGIPQSPSGDTPSTTNMRTIERFTRVAPDQINYELTIEDPEVLTDKWVVSYPMYLDAEYRFFEYACHEDNSAVRNFIETSRYERANPEEFAQPAGRGGRGAPGGGRGGPRAGGPGTGQ